MNFIQWRESLSGFIRREQLPEPSAKVGWDACKKEVLEILNTSIHTSNGIQIYFGENQGLINKIKEEVEKL